MEEDQQHDMHAAMDHPMHAMSNPSAHDTHQEHVMPASDEISRAIHYPHAGHGGDHSGHEQLFPVHFWGRLLLSIPVLLCSGMILM